MTHFPATNLTDAFNACNPSAPLDAGDPRYVDLSEGRGDEGSAIGQCLKRILRSAEPLAQIFAGHRGSGKSTELRGLKKNLEDAGYFVAYFEVDEDVDLEDTEPTDILLAIVRNLEKSLRDAGLDVSEKLLDDFLLWFADVVLETTDHKKIEAEVRSELSLGAEVPLFAKLLARFTGQVKTGTESKRLLRRRLDPQVSQLVERGRLLVTAARGVVKDAGKKDLVLIVDNLDRITLKDRGDNRTSHEVLFIERGELLASFGCHNIITVPVSLLFSPQLANLNAIFPDRHVLPMVKLVDRQTGSDWEKGRLLLRNLLRHRVDVGSLFEDGVESALITASGGHPRLFMSLIRYAIDFTDEPPVTKAAVRKAFRKLINDYGRSTPGKHWSLLARVHREKAVLNDEAHQLMLFNLSVLEYQNEERWCGVQPAILELPVFQAALAKLDAQGNDGSQNS